MSADLYQTRLYWDGRRGVAKADGVSVDLHAAPEVLGRPVEIDFAPEARVAEMRPRHCDPRRDMTPDEAAAVIAWLMRMTLAAKAAIGVA